MQYFKPKRKQTRTLGTTISSSELNRQQMAKKNRGSQRSREKQRKKKLGLVPVNVQEAFSLARSNEIRGALLIQSDHCESAQ